MILHFIAYRWGSHYFLVGRADIASSFHWLFGGGGGGGGVSQFTSAHRYCSSVSSTIHRGGGLPHGLILQQFIAEVGTA